MLCASSPVDLGLRPVSDIATVISALRASRGWSLRALADLLDVHTNTVWLWEQGQRWPNARDLQRLADVAGVRLQVGANGWRVSGAGSRGRR